MSLFSNYILLVLMIFGFFLIHIKPCKGYDFDYDNEYDAYDTEEEEELEEESDDEEFSYGDVYNFDETEILIEDEELQLRKGKNKKMKSGQFINNDNPLSHRIVKSGLTIDDNGDEDTHYGSHSKTKISSPFRPSDSFNDRDRNDEVDTMFHKQEQAGFRTVHNNKVHEEEQFDYADDHRGYDSHYRKDEDTARDAYAPEYSPHHVKEEEYSPHHVKETDTRRDSFESEYAPHHVKETDTRRDPYESEYAPHHDKETDTRKDPYASEYTHHHVKEQETRREPYAPTEHRYHPTPSPPHPRPILSKAVPISDTKHPKTIFDTDHFTDIERAFTPEKDSKHHQEGVAHLFRHDDQ